MKTILIGVNAKYIHPNLAIRLLKKNTTYPCDIKEFTIKDEVNEVVKYLYDGSYQVVAFSCYIWNIEFIKKVLEIIKNDFTIILGGPEVSYNAGFYLKNQLAHYVIKNEGEEAFDLLLNYLDQKISINEVPNLYHKDGFTFDKLVDLEKSKMAYDLLDDVKNKIVYIETSRGCPYHCAYCMASLDNKVRFFNIEEIKNQILILLEKGARVFKFLDRTFNANKKHFIALIDFIILNHRKNNSFQFEITGDLLNPDIIDYINERAPKNLFRFEIGIQSTNVKSNLSVGRIQNNEKLFNNIQKIQAGGVIDLHLDLIAGLPYEDYASFAKTFNDVLSLKPKELQLGFLKLLHGTKMKEDAIKYNYKWQATAPYEIIENAFLSPNDIKEIHYAEDAFEYYYNSGFMPNAMELIIDNETNPFQFFNALGHTTYKHLSLELAFKNIDDFMKDKRYYQLFHEKVIFDYLNYFKVKPKAWWDEACQKDERNMILRLLDEKNLLPIKLVDAYKYSLVIKLKDIYILAIYQSNKKIIQIFNSDDINE